MILYNFDPINIYFMWIKCVLSQPMLDTSRSAAVMQSKSHMTVHKGEIWELGREGTYKRYYYIFILKWILWDLMGSTKAVWLYLYSFSTCNIFFITRNWSVCVFKCTVERVLESHIIWHNEQKPAFVINVSA